MRQPAFILAVSLVAVLVAVVLPGWSDLLLLAGPCALAAAYLLLRAARRQRSPDVRGRQIVLDGSNVMHWRDGTPDIETLRDVLSHLTARGYDPGIVFDANAGNLMFGRYRHDGFLAHELGLREDRVMVVPKATSADPAILRAARDLGAPVVTNDRYRDWLEAFPEARQPGYLIRGGYRHGKLWLDLPADIEARDAPVA